jgi:[acyl-carrier-protein] S-malonyltransferase
LGMSPADVAEVCKKAAEGDVVSPANLNSPEQTVIAGSAAAVKRAVETASQAGAKRAVVLAVSAPFHCSMLSPAQQRLEPDLRAVKFSAPKFPVITNVDAEAVETGDEARDSLIRQVTMPVRWLDSVREMMDLGVNIFVEVGPGKVLTGLMRQIDRSVRMMNVEDSATLQSTIEKITQARAEAPES